jgi:hypothetical protein
MAFQQAGCKVFAICPPGHPIRFVQGIEAVYPYRMLSPSASLQSALHAAKPDLIVPCDDAATWHLHALHTRCAEFRPLIERSLGAPEFYPALRSRNDVLETARKLGIRVPFTRPLGSLGDFSDLYVEWPAVLKIDGTWGGEGIAVIPNPDEAGRILNTLCKANGAGRAWKRFLLNRHPLSLWLWRRHRTCAITVQAFIPGRPATTLFACRSGQVLASVTMEVLSSNGPTGSATVIRLLKNEEIESAARLLAKRFGLNGLHGLDFVLEETTGAAYMIEMNPRATQLGHLRVLAQGSLADVLARRSSRESVTATANKRSIPGDTIVLFPQEWKTNPANPLLHEAYHDVPWEQPELVVELTRDIWPRRRFLNRLFELLHRWLPLRSAAAPPESSKKQSPLAN